VARHEPFREHLAAFELRRGARRTEDPPPRGTETIDDTAIERQLGTDHGEVDRFARGEREQRIRIARIDVGARGDRCGARIARRGDDEGRTGVPREPPDERVLAPPAASNEDPHETAK
jgi:hypothetical protein